MAAQLVSFGYVHDVDNAESATFANCPANAQRMKPQKPPRTECQAYESLVKIDWDVASRHHDCASGWHAA
jgi:hypothetical protein